MSRQIPSNPRVIVGWHHYEREYAKLTLRNHGDPTEIEAAVKYHLDKDFGNYETFWKFHVAPSTQRPANTYHRAGASELIKRISQTSHGILCDLVDCCSQLVLVQAGHLGGDRFTNCVQCIKAGGDAIQKFTNLQELVQGPIRANSPTAPSIWLSQALNQPIQLTHLAGWQTLMQARTQGIGYRNYITHQGSPQVTMISNGTGQREPYVLRRGLYVPGNDLWWDNPKYDYRRNPGDWQPLVDVCAELKIDAVKWQNDAYGLLVNALAPLLYSPHYQRLWGWDAVEGPQVPSQQVASPVQMTAMSGVRNA